MKSGAALNIWIAASYEAIGRMDPAVYAQEPKWDETTKMSDDFTNKFERVLFYHPESDCYLECLDQEKYDWCTRSGGEPLDEVTGINHHEANFLQQQYEEENREDTKGGADDCDDLLGGYVAGDEDLL